MNEARTLKQARLAAGLTFREVGEAARLATSTVAHYESGRTSPSDAALRRWRKALAGLLADRSNKIADILKHF